MHIDNFTVTAPLMLGGEYSEAEILGSAVWLWMHSPMHRDAPLHTLPTLLLPPIKQQQFILISENNKPVFFLDWAWMDEEAEHRYLTQPAIMIQDRDWLSGNRMWILDWIAPFGHTEKFKKMVHEIILPNHFGWFKYHKNSQGKSPITVRKWSGSSVEKATRDRWYQDHPLAYDL